MGDFLIKFNRSLEGLPSADFWEKTGDLGFGLLRLGLGKTVNVMTPNAFRQAQRSLAERIVCVALSVLIFPVTLILAGVGSLGYAVSQSRKEVLSKYSDKKNLQESDVSLSVKAPDIKRESIQEKFKREDKISLPHYEHFLDWHLERESRIADLVLEMVKQELPDLSLNMSMRIRIEDDKPFEDFLDSENPLERLKQLVQREIIDRRPEAFPEAFIEKIDAAFLDRIPSGLKQQKVNSCIEIFFTDLFRQNWCVEEGKPFDKEDIPGFVSDLFKRYYAYLLENCDKIPAIIESYKNLARHTGISDRLSEEEFIDLLINGSISERKPELVEYVREHCRDPAFMIDENEYSNDRYTLSAIKWIQQAVMCSRPNHLLSDLIAKNPALQGLEDYLLALPKIALLNMMMTVNQMTRTADISRRFDPPLEDWSPIFSNEIRRSKMSKWGETFYEVKPDLNGVKVQTDYSVYTIKAGKYDRQVARFRCTLEIPAIVPFKDEDKAFTLTTFEGLAFGKDATDEEVQLLEKTLLK